MVTAASRAYSVIQDAIISGELAEGVKISEDSLARRLGVSRTPVREALRRLSAEGLVEFLPNRGARVVAWTTEDLADLFRARALVESYAASLAAEATDEPAVQGLYDLQARMEACARKLDDDSREELGRLDVELHRAVVAGSSSKRLLDMYDRLTAVPTQHSAMRKYTKSELADRLNQHRQVVVAIERGDAEWAGAIMRAHVLSGWRLLVDQREKDTREERRRVP